MVIDSLRQAVQEIGLSAVPLCVHSSLRSFGNLEGGAAALIDALLAERCTILVPTFSYSFGVLPPTHMRPARNGWDYDTVAALKAGVSRIYSHETSELDSDMGALSVEVLKRPGRKRGRHPLNSFTALGPLANHLVREQTPTNVYAPLRALAAEDGFVVMMGVGLDKLTLIHLAEQMARRTLFRRWANAPNGQPMMVEVGGCANGFGKLEPILTTQIHTRRVNHSLWRVLPVQAALDAVVPAIRVEPMLSHCGDFHCERCNDAVAGGPNTSTQP